MSKCSFKFPGRSDLLLVLSPGYPAAPPLGGGGIDLYVWMRSGLYYLTSAKNDPKLVYLKASSVLGIKVTIKKKKKASLVLGIKVTIKKKKKKNKINK